MKQNQQAASASNCNGAANPKKLNKEIDLLVETSWEVCNKVGGIYTVLSTKAKELQSQFGDKLIFVGPDLWSEDNPCPVFKENKRLLKSASRFLELPQGVSIRTGYWEIPGRPIVVLVNYQGVYDFIDKIFGEMWEHFRVDSLHGYGDYRESCTFAVASAIVIEALMNRLGVKPAKTVAHWDEWTTGMGLLYLRLRQPTVAEIFTTHATSIGRSICSNGKDLYRYFHDYNGDQMAYELNMQSKHSLEKAAAHAADCFTTVSEVTARECEQLLDIRPQVVTPNGFDPAFVPSADDAAKLRRQGRAKLFEVASMLTGRTLPPDTLVVATSGRNEFRNKGIDLFLDSIAELRNRHNTKREVLALVLVPAWVKEPSGALVTDLFENGDIHPAPDFLTHRLNNEDSDAIVNKIRSIGGNQGDSKVEIIDIPCYLDGHDGVLNISYYDLLPAIDATAFPSYYEPWGYTPLESVAFGVPTVTTDKSGFGQWILSTTDNDPKDCGVRVIPRDDTNYSLDVAETADFIQAIAAASPAEIKQIADAARHTADRADWSKFITIYDEAFATALCRRDARLANK